MSKRTTKKTKPQALTAVSATVFHSTIKLLLLAERTCRRRCTKTQNLHFMTLAGRVVSFASLLATEARATVLPDTPLTTGVFTINCLVCVRENFSVARQGYAAQCWSQEDTKASITETVQAKPPEKAKIFPLPPRRAQGSLVINCDRHGLQGRYTRL